MRAHPVLHITGRMLLLACCNAVACSVDGSMGSEERVDIGSNAPAGAEEVAADATGAPSSEATNSANSAAPRVSADVATAAYGPCVQENSACGGELGLCAVGSDGFHRCLPPCEEDADCPEPVGAAAVPTCLHDDVIVNGVSGECLLMCAGDEECPGDSVCFYGVCEFSNAGIDGFPQPGEADQACPSNVATSDGLSCAVLP